MCFTSMPYRYSLPVFLTNMPYQYTLPVWFTVYPTSIPYQYALLYLTNMRYQYRPYIYLIVSALPAVFLDLTAVFLTCSIHYTFEKHYVFVFYL